MTDPAIQFAEEARRFCALVEDEDSQNSWCFARDCLRTLLRLYETALLLQPAEHTSPESGANIDYPEWKHTLQTVQRKLAKDFYWSVFEPFESEQPEPVGGSLSDDLADIWRDIKGGLLTLARENPSVANDAVWHWRFSFETHWAHHASSAIRALDALRFGEFADTSRPANT